MARRTPITAHPYPHSDLPSLRLITVAVIGNILGVIHGVWLTLWPGVLGVFWGLFWLLALSGGLVINLRTWRGLLVKRQEIRAENEKNWWRDRQLDYIDHPTDWEMVELGIELLLAEGVEPTVERALSRVQ